MNCKSEEFEVKVEVYQGLKPSPLPSQLCCRPCQRNLEKVHQGNYFMQMLAESEQKLMEKIDL